mmetsp:Transcript_11352/g.37918  ORF Transcript_11352/g.37918 Transcript_11352/m.37918 type:complete len:212 (+) Transcript_11352:752-1387(+)
MASTHKGAIDSSRSKGMFCSAFFKIPFNDAASVWRTHRFTSILATRLCTRCVTSILPFSRVAMLVVLPRRIAVSRGAMEFTMALCCCALSEWPIATMRPLNASGGRDSQTPSRSTRSSSPGKTPRAMTDDATTESASPSGLMTWSSWCGGATVGAAALLLVPYGILSHPGTFAKCHLASRVSALRSLCGRGGGCTNALQRAPAHRRARRIV